MIDRRCFCLSALAALSACVSRVDEKYIRAPAGPDEGPFSLEYRGVGTIILRAKTAADEHVGIVVPTVPFDRDDAAYVLELESVAKLDVMILCSLHGHWDHSNHLDLFARLLKPGGQAVLIADDSRALRSRVARADIYTRITPGSEPITLPLFAGRAELSLRFVVQGLRGDGHAAHYGSGKRCGPRHPHCGTYLLPSPPRTLCLLATISIGNREFTVFVNDAASAYVSQAVAQAVAQELVGPVDLALIAAPDAHLAYGYPDELLEVLDADAVRWVHWEDFVGHPKNSRDRLESGADAHTGGPRVLSEQTIEALQHLCGEENGCFLPHRHREFFAGRWVCGH